MQGFKSLLLRQKISIPHRGMDIFTLGRNLNRSKCNSPVELYECGIRCYFLVFCGLFPRFSYDMVTAARCPRTGIVPQSSAEVKRAFCSVGWQTGGASLRSAERVEQQSSKEGAAEDSCPLYLCVLFRCIMLVTCVMQHCSYGAIHSCNPFPLGEPRILLSAKWYGVLICRHSLCDSSVII